MWLYAQGKLVVLRAKLTHSYTCLPHFALAHGLQFLFQLLAIVGLRVAVDRDLCLVACLHRVIEPLHNGLDGVMETGSPIQCTTLSCGRAVGLHPVHTFLSEEGAKALSELFNSLVESFRGSMTILTQYLVLSEQQSLYGSHQ